MVCACVPKLLEGGDHVVKRATNPWSVIHGLADHMRLRVRRAFLEAAYAAVSLVGPTKLVSLLETGDVPAILAVLRPATDSLEKALRAGDFAAALAETFRRAGTAEAIETGKGFKTTSFAFDLTDPKAVRFLDVYDGNLITGFTSETQQAIIAVVQQGFKLGWTPQQQAEQIASLPIFGLTARQNVSLMNYANSVKNSGVSEDVLKSRVASQARRIAAHRAETIARTETIRAAEYGRLEAWRQAGERGLFSPDAARRTWIVTPDDRLCPYCRDVHARNKDGVRFNEQFQSPDGSAITCPPAHPLCRCTQGIVFGEK